MKIALVFPRFKYPSGEPPLGIAYIASSILKNTKAKVDILDATFEASPEEYLKNAFKKNRYDLVGVSFMSSMVNDAFKAAELAKKYSKAIVIMGGPHTTILPEQTLKNRCVDAVCIGEGEEIFVDIIKNKGSLRGIKGIWYKKNNGIVKNKPREPVKNLDSLPFPAWDLLPIKKYMQSWFQMDTISESLKGASLIASRGCPYNCTYCQPTLFTIFGRTIRKRSPKNIVGELKELKKRYNISAFGLQDDTFIFDKQWVLDFCKELRKQKLSLIWQCNVRANLVAEELLSEMKKAGLRRIAVGVESASQRILDKIYRKGIKIEQVKNTLEIADKLGLKVHCYFMIGAPTETLAEIKKTIRFAMNKHIDTATFSITTPLPHTYLYEESKQYIKNGTREFDYYKKSVYNTPIVLPQSKLNFLKKTAYLEFYLTPPRLHSTIKALLSFEGIRKTFLKLQRV